MARIQMVSMTKIPLLFASFALIFVNPDAMNPGHTTGKKETRGQSYGNTTLRCDFEDNNLTNYKWEKNEDINATECFDNLTIAQSINEHNGDLEFENITREDSGTYERTANEDNRTITFKARLIIPEVPEIKLFDVKPIGVGNIEFKWEVNDGNDPVTKYSILYEKIDTNTPKYFGEIIRGGDSKYHLNPEKLKKGITYKLSIEATNSVGVSRKFYSNSFTPLKKDRNGEHEVRLKSNNYGTLSCHSGGNNFTRYGWSKISGSSDHKRLNNLKTKQGIPMTLTFENVIREDSGTYKFWGANDNYYISSECHLIVTEVPEVKIERNRAHAHTVELWWSINDHNETVTKYSIEYRRRSFKDVSVFPLGKKKIEWVHCLDNIDPKKSHYNVKGLDSDTEYQFRIIATNSVGDSIPANSTWITTLKPDPHLVPYSFSTTKSDRSIKIHFERPPANLRNDDYYYIVKYTQRGLKGRTKKTDVNVQYFTLNHLDPGTSYAIKIQACYFKTKQCGLWSIARKINTDHGGMKHDKLNCRDKTRRGCGRQSIKSNKNISSDLHPAGINFVSIITVSLYIAVKYI